MSRLLSELEILKAMEEVNAFLDDPTSDRKTIWKAFYELQPTKTELEKIAQEKKINLQLLSSKQLPTISIKNARIAYSALNENRIRQMRIEIQITYINGNLY